MYWTNKTLTYQSHIIVLYISSIVHLFELFPCKCHTQFRTYHSLCIRLFLYNCESRKANRKKTREKKIVDCYPLNLFTKQLIEIKKINIFCLLIEKWLIHDILSFLLQLNSHNTIYPLKCCFAKIKYVNKQCLMAFRLVKTKFQKKKHVKENKKKRMQYYIGKHSYRK